MKLYNTSNPYFACMNQSIDTKPETNLNQSIPNHENNQLLNPLKSNNNRPIVYQIKNCMFAQVIKRPSKTCKTPQVADIKLLSNPEEQLNFMCPIPSDKTKLNQNNIPMMSTQTQLDDTANRITNMTNITLDDTDFNTATPTQMAHTPALGCSGLVDLGSTVIVCPKEERKSNASKSVTSHIV